MHTYIVLQVITLIIFEIAVGGERGYSYINIGLNYLR